MTEPTIWETLHFPVLKAAVAGVLADRNFAGVRIHEIAETTGLPDEDVLAALRQLEGDGFVELRLMMPARAGRVVRVFGPALRAVGEWPSAEGFADRLLAALEDLAEHGGDEVTKSKARKALDGLGSLTRDTLVSVAGAAAGVAMQQ